MSRFLKVFRWVFVLQVSFLAAGLALAVGENDPRYVGELHPPVVISEEEKKIAVLFLKSNLKDSVEGYHVPAGEIYYFRVQPLEPVLEYVWKVEGEQILSVFFYGWKSRERAGRSMYVLTKTAISNRAFQGYSYAVMEFPVVFEESGLSLGFFLGDHPDPKLINCYEGVYLDDKRKVSCEYKNAGAIKKYFALQDSGGGD